MTGIPEKVSQAISDAHNSGLETGLEIAEQRINAAEETAAQLAQAALNTELGRQIQQIRDDFNRDLAQCRESLELRLSERFQQVEHLSADLSSVRTELQDLTLSMLILTEAEEATETLSTQTQLQEAEPETVKTPQPEKSQESNERKSKRVFR